MSAATGMAIGVVCWAGVIVAILTGCVWFALPQLAIFTFVTLYPVLAGSRPARVLLVILVILVGLALPWAVIYLCLIWAFLWTTILPVLGIGGDRRARYDQDSHHMDGTGDE